MAQLANRKSIRLPPDAYREPGSSWLVALAAPANTRPFADSSFAGATLATMTDEVPGLGIDLRLACLMPDHAHLLATVVDGDLVSAVRALKSRFTLVYHGFGYRGTLWQRSFHDHGIRTAEAFAAAVRYVVENPVAAGLVATWEEYDLIDGSRLGESRPSP